MAGGITNRTAFRPGSYGTPDVNSLARDVQRWGNYLPFGSYGFQVTNSVPTSLPANTTTPLFFDTIIQDRENWMQSQVNPFSAFVVPSGGSGVYLISINHRLTTPVNDLLVTSVAPTQLMNVTAGNSVDSTSLGVTVALNPDDVIVMATEAEIELVGNNNTLTSAFVELYWRSSGGTDRTPFSSGGRFGTLHGGLGMSNTAIAMQNHFGRVTVSGTFAAAENRLYRSSYGGTFTPQTFGITQPDTYTLRCGVTWTGLGAGGYPNNGAIMTVGPSMITRKNNPQNWLSVAIQVNGDAISVDDMSTGLFGETVTMRWLNDGDVISAVVANSSSRAVVMDANNVASPTVPQLPLLTATRIALI